MSPTWMNRSKESEAARMAAHRARRQQRGNCIRCGMPQDPNSQQLCTMHLTVQREYQRKRLGLKRRVTR